MIRALRLFCAECTECVGGENGKFAVSVGVAVADAVLWVELPNVSVVIVNIHLPNFPSKTTKSLYTLTHWHQLHIH